MAESENKETEEVEQEEEEEANEQEQEQGSRSGAKRGRRAGVSYSKKKKGENLNLYIYKVLKQIHPDIGLSKNAMSVLNSFMLDVFDRLATEAANAVKYTKKNTMDARAIECAVRLCLPGEFAKHAQKEGKKALALYTQNK